MFILFDQHNLGCDFVPFYPGVTVHGSLPLDMSACPSFEAIGEQLAVCGAKLRVQLAKQSKITRAVMFLGDSIARLSMDSEALEQVRAIVHVHWSRSFSGSRTQISIGTIKALMLGLLRTRSTTLFQFWRR